MMLLLWFRILLWLMLALILRSDIGGGRLGHGGIARRFPYILHTELS